MRQVLKQCVQNVYKMCKSICLADKYSILLEILNKTLSLKTAYCFATLSLLHEVCLQLPWVYYIFLEYLEITATSTGQLSPNLQRTADHTAELGRPIQ